MFDKIKLYNYLFFFVLAIAQCHKPIIYKEINISDWEFREQGKEWLPASVPGFLHLDLFSNHLIDDPFYRSNENKLGWIEEKTWEYRARFMLDSNFIQKNHIYITFSGIDTYTDVYLNDSLLLSCDNYFVTYNIKLDTLLEGSNELLFVFHPTIEIASKIQVNDEYDLPGNERVYVRKPQFHFGWDWGPRLIGCGITKNVTLKAFNNAHISNYYIETLSIEDNIAHMRLELELLDYHADAYKIEFMGQRYRIDSNTNSIDFSIENPRLWWPRGYGSQYHYPLDLKLFNANDEFLDQINDRFAIRQIHLIQDQVHMGKGFKFQVNGLDVYAKGANYIPLDFFHTRVDSSMYRKALIDVVDANMNMLRVWGGGLYETDYFYDLCDSLGILVWQDFMFACAMYPGTEDFMRSVEIEATQQIKRLRKHPSIALWCGNNENSEGWHRWGWQSNRSAGEIDSIWTNYQGLFTKLLPKLVDSLSSSDYWESSPKYGRGDPKHQFIGDAHYWGVWHDIEPFKNFELKVPRFMSEFGFQSFPEMNALSKFTIDNDLSLDSEVIKSHQKHPRGNDLIKEYMQRDYKEPVNFESFVYLSQILQANGIRKGIEAHRRARPYNMGTLYWQFNDCWPSVSWSSRDYYGNWKALHYAAKLAYEDLLISTVQSEDSLFIYVVNDSKYYAKCDLLINHVDYDGNDLKQTTSSSTYDGFSSQLLKSIPLADYYSNDTIENKSYIDIKLLVDHKIKSRKIHHFVDPKDMNLSHSKITHVINKDSLGYEIQLLSDVFVKDLMIECTYEGRFDDNYFDLPANEPKRIRFYNDEVIYKFKDSDLSFFSIIDTYK